MLFSIVFWEAPHNNAALPILAREGSPGHFSHPPHLTPSPSHSLALGNIHFGKPLPGPLLP